MDQPETSPGGGARTAYVMKLLEEINERPFSHKRRLVNVQTKGGRQKRQFLRPIRLYEGVITTEAKGRIFYPTLLLTKRNTLVRGVLHGSRVYYVPLSFGELTDKEVRDLTKVVRGNRGLDSSDYIRIAHLPRT